MSALHCTIVHYCAVQCSAVHTRHSTDCTGCTGCTLDTVQRVQWAGDTGFPGWSIHLHPLKTFCLTDHHSQIMMIIIITDIMMMQRRWRWWMRQSAIMNEVCMLESPFPNSVQLTQQVHSYSSTPLQTIMMMSGKPQPMMRKWRYRIVASAKGSCTCRNK